MLLDFLVSSVPAKTRLARARTILALEEGSRLGRPATWDEWNGIWFGHADWTPDAAIQAFKRLRRMLKPFNVDVPACREKWLDATAPAVRELVLLWSHTARRIEARSAVGLRVEAAGVRAAEIVAAAAGTDREQGPRSYAELKRRFGIGHERLHYLLACKKATRAPRRRRTIDDIRAPQKIAEALAIFDRGGTVRCVAAALDTCASSAWKFLKRHGRSRARGA